MSLLSAAMEPFIIMNKIKTEDGYGGYTTTWAAGPNIDAVAIFDSSIESRVAQVQGVSSVYTVTTNKNVILEYHDVIKRVRDNKIFRITSDGDDKYTPSEATLNMRQVTAEEWELING